MQTQLRMIERYLQQGYNTVIVDVDGHPAPAKLRMAHGHIELVIGTIHHKINVPAAYAALLEGEVFTVEYSTRSR